MPKDYESIIALNKVQEIFGGISSERILLKGDLTDPEIAKAVYGLSIEKMVESGFEEGDILGIATYLDFLKYQLPAMAQESGVEMNFDLSEIPDEQISQFLQFYLNPDPESPLVEPLMRSLLGDDYTPRSKPSLWLPREE